MSEIQSPTLKTHILYSVGHRIANW